MFGVQQSLEGLIWLSLATPTNAYAGLSAEALTQAYSAFSQVLWPVYVPVSIWLLEPVAWRRKVLLGISAGGALVSLFLLTAMLDHPVVAKVQGHHIAYAFSHVHIVAATLLYLMGTCVAPMLSSRISVRLFGIAVFVSSVLAYAVYSAWFISVWCFFAGLLSCIVLFNFLPRATKFSQVSPKTE